MFSIEIFVKFYLLSIVVLFGFALYIINQNFELNSNTLTSGLGCIVPPHPSNGWCSILQQSNREDLGTFAPAGTMLRSSCNESYKLQGYNTSICWNGNWFPEIAKCLKTCPAMLSTRLMKVKCSYDNKIMKSCEGAIDNTTAQFICVPFYEDERSTRMKAMCRNGQWSEGVPQCVPVCGRRKTEKVVPFIINGTTTKIGEFPWQVAIYKNSINICGGTLLHERLILTAAHCLSNEDGKPHPIDEYRVIVGSYYRSFSTASKEKNAQTSTINAIYIPEGYVGSAKLYYGDIAVVVPNKIFRLSSTVQPICIDWTNEYENTFFYSEKPTGIVAGWGYTIEYYKSSNVLRSLEVPIIDRENCTQLLSKIDYRDYITGDKICAGYINKSKSVCLGDSGSGLIYNHNGRYYILGIVSISLPGCTENGGCDSQNLGFYTHISNYLDDLIEEYYMRYKPFRFPLVNNDNTQTTLPEVATAAALSRTAIFKQNYPIDSCILPQNPEFGQWSLYGTTSSKLVPGVSAKSGTILKIHCQKGYKLNGDKIIACENGTWSSSMAECLKTCSTINSTETMTVTCFHEMGKLKNCVDPVSGTKARYYCAPFYEDMKQMEHPLYCMNGTWSPSLPQCVPKCGHKSLIDLVHDKANSTRSDFPWLIAVYKKGENDIICTGTLLTNRHILVNSKCLNKYGTNKENFVLVAGKFFQKLHNSTAFEKIQVSNIQDVVIHQGQALIIATVPFQFSLKVQPVCIDWDRRFQKDMTEKYISGWGYSVRDSKIVVNDRLTTVKVDLASSEQCKMNLAEDYMNMTDEKLCVRYRLNGTALCLGEEGGGLFVKDDNNRYYIVGIMDISNNVQSCAERQYGFYTSVYKSMDTFIAILKN